jgi:hypothetical protein
MSACIEKDEDILEKLEYEYRRGVTHGFELALGIADPLKIAILKKRLIEWKWDLENIKGIPGSKFEDIDFPWRKMILKIRGEKC